MSNRLSIRRRLGIISFVLLPVTALAFAQQWQSSAFSKDPFRQFDFWVGDWTVNLRVRQPDFTWKDSATARTKIYPILEGKAILELWDSPAIKGYSLRYYDPGKEKWVLWLNWPGNNRSGSSSLEGEFRHGRGEFFSKNRNASGEEVINRYTFSDITPTSLRWDDAFSSDGGNTWRNNWIMEFSRQEDQPSWPDSENAHTFETGQRCSAEPFRAYESLAGIWDVNVGGSRGQVTGQLKSFKVLDGCALIALLTVDERNLGFWHFTYNTYAQVYEITLLDSDRSHPAWILYGNLDGNTFELTSRQSDPSQFRMTIHLGDQEVTREFFARRNGEWQLVSKATLRRR